MIDMVEKWKEEFKSKNFRIVFFIIIPLFIFSLITVANYLQYNEARRTYPINDPILALFTATDLTWFTFFLIYGGILFAVIHLLSYPRALMIAFLSYVFCVSARIITMYLLPLDAPPGIIPLTDPTVAFFGGGETFLKDLFFSGHTSVMFLLYLTAQKKPIRLTFFIATFLVATSLLLQHAHYSIDIFAAPFFAYVSFKIAEKILNYYFKRRGSH